MNKEMCNNLINACNNCILSCQKSLKKCKYGSDTHDLNHDEKENCAASQQDLITKCQECIHACNAILDNNDFQNKEYKEVIKECKDVCKDTLDRCQESINKILNGNSSGVIWAFDQINECIRACDKCVEMLNQR